MYARVTRRAIALLWLAVLATGLAAGCGSDEDRPREREGRAPAPIEVSPPSIGKAGDKDDDDGGGWFFLVATGACALIVGVIAGAAGASFLRGNPGAATALAPAQPQPAASPPPPAPREDDSRLVADRTALVNALIRLDSRLDNPAMVEQVSAGLAKAGVEVIEVADGTPFDALKHQAGGAAYTDDESKHMTVCATEQRGYRDRGKVLQLPIVTIYTYPGA